MLSYLTDYKLLNRALIKKIQGCRQSALIINKSTSEIRLMREISRCSAYALKVREVQRVTNMCKKLNERQQVIIKM